MEPDQPPSAVAGAEVTASSLEHHLAAAPLSPRQWLVWGLATAGKLLEGAIVFSGGIALPLQARQFGMSELETGCVAAASLVGILSGALLLGGLADRFGRRPVFIAEMVLLLVGLVAAALSSSSIWLLLALLLIGLALGADYPTAHLVISESIPAAVRGRLVLIAFSAQALGVVLGTAASALLLALQPGGWRLLYLLAALPVALVALARLLVPESGAWLLSRGEHRAAEVQLQRLLHRADLALAAPRQISRPIARPGPSWRELWRPPLRRSTVLATLPWFLQDIGTYGIGLFTPLLLSLTPESIPAAAVGDGLAAAPLAARGTALVDLALLPGIAIAVLLVDRWGRIPLQILGFLGCAAGLLLAAFASVGWLGPTGGGLLLTGLVLFQFMTNLGPNGQTYLLAGELFPTRIRGLGAGLAAAAGKLGAVITAFGFPLLLPRLGSGPLLVLLAVSSVLGAAVTWFWRLETRGADLEAPRWGLADEAGAG